MSIDTILQKMIDSDTKGYEDYVISHHKIDNPYRIDVKTDEIIYIDKLGITEKNQGFWLEFHSATDSRTIQEENYNQITRHKGTVNFSHKEVIHFWVSYIRLSLIK